MSEEQKIETKATSVRLPLDVIETLQRWSEETGQSVAGCITTCVRVAMEDEKRITNSPNGEIQKGGEIQIAAGSVIHVPFPKNRDELADALTFVIRESSGRIGDRDQVSALGVTRARVYKTTPEYAAGSQMRAAKGLAPSVYEDEKKLAKMLSEGGGAGDLGGVREKGDKTR